MVENVTQEEKKGKGREGKGKQKKKERKKERTRRVAPGSRESYAAARRR
jgi:hypothetical protein